MDKELIWRFWRRKEYSGYCNTLNHKGVAKSRLGMLFEGNFKEKWQNTLQYKMFSLSLTVIVLIRDILRGNKK